MIVTETFLKGCFTIKPNVFEDKRGSFFEAFNHKKFEEKIGSKVNFVQDNQSISQKGVLRGLHMQKGKFSQSKLVRVIKGKVLDVAVDIRANSSTFGEIFSIILSGDNNKQLFVPKGFLHGFSVLEEHTIVAYKCDNYYHKEAECGVIYNDEDLNIDWMLDEKEIIVSEKDRKLKTFKEFIG